jgi:hypothetical protein
MIRKKTRPRRRREPRRTIYESALSKAEAELERRVAQRTETLRKLEYLSVRIPYLENLVSALSEPPAASSRDREVGPSSDEARVAPVPIPTPTSQEDWLQKYMPSAGRLTTSTPPVRVEPSGNSADPDEFLSDEPVG